MPQETLESLMRDVFRAADTDGSGALSRKVGGRPVVQTQIMLHHIKTRMLHSWLCILYTLLAACFKEKVIDTRRPIFMWRQTRTHVVLLCFAGVQGVPAIRHGHGAQAVAAGHQHAADGGGRRRQRPGGLRGMVLCHFEMVLRHSVSMAIEAVGSTHMGTPSLCVVCLPHLWIHIVRVQEFIPVAFNILVERLKASLLAAEAAGTTAS